MVLEQFLDVLRMINEDFDFAKKYKLEIKTVVKPFDKNDNYHVTNEAYSGPGIIINSDFLNGFEAPKDSVIKTIELLKKKIGKQQINYRLKDWEFPDKDTGVVQYQWLMMKTVRFIQYQNLCCQ